MTAMRTIVREFRLAIRRLRRAPAFVAAGTLSLVLGIGANTAIFSAVEAVLLRPLPVAGLSSVVALESDIPSMSISHAALAPAEVTDLAERRDVFRQGFGIRRALSCGLRSRLIR